MKEMLVIICNNGCGDDVMVVAKKAGATGGTILHGRGTADESNFFNMIIQSQKEVVLIVADEKEKMKIMREISGRLGAGTKAHAVCFSVPVDATVGLGKNIIKEENNNQKN